MGRPAHRPDATTRRQVEAMSAYGVPELNIASVIGIDPKTLRKHYRRRTRQRPGQGNGESSREPLPKGDDRRPAIGDRGDLLAQNPRRLEGDECRSKSVETSASR